MSVESMAHSYPFLENPDIQVSPYTGMTRKHWLAAARFLCEGVFAHQEHMDDPIVMPKQNKISYPQPDDPPHRFKAAEFEGLARTMMAASPLIVEDASTRCNGFCLRDYYAEMILKMVNPQSPRYLGRLSEIIAKYGRSQQQHTVEGAALVINLMHTRDQIWNQYSQAEKDQIADLLSDIAHGLSIGHNWRFFNVLMLTFLKIHGYPIDESVLTDHMQHLISCYAGDGWYADDTNYDMYNPWGFHFYGPLWCRWYGYEYEPEMAAVIEQRNREFVKTWPHFFARDGRQLMWGRSIIYRFAASTALGAHFLMNDPVLDPGFARRIASGNILQFLTRDDLYVNGLPCLGYYGPFEPLIQFYSCAASPFWMAKVFVALTLPQESPFWTAVENEGFWNSLGATSRTIDLPGPGMQIVNHGRTGTTELRSGKALLHEPYYNQLQFNPHFPLESESPEGTNPANYSIRELNMGHDFRIPLNIAFNKFENGILYRQQNTQPVGLGDPNKGGINRGPERIDLADIIVPGGVIRVDRVRVPYRNELQLGHYALPHLNSMTPTLTTLELGGYYGIQGALPDRQVALVAIHGWDKVDTAHHVNTNPEAPHSTVIYAERIRNKDYCGMEILITVMLHRLDEGQWSEDELMPIASYEILPLAPSGNACGVKLTLKDGRTYLIDYGNVDGRRIM